MSHHPRTPQSSEVAKDVYEQVYFTSLDLLRESHEQAAPGDAPLVMACAEMGMTFAVANNLVDRSLGFGEGEDDLRSRIVVAVSMCLNECCDKTLADLCGDGLEAFLEKYSPKD